MKTAVSAGVAFSAPPAVGFSFQAPVSRVADVWCLSPCIGVLDVEYSVGGVVATFISACVIIFKLRGRDVADVTTSFAEVVTLLVADGVAAAVVAAVVLSTEVTVVTGCDVC